MGEEVEGGVGRGVRGEVSSWWVRVYCHVL